MIKQVHYFEIIPIARPAEWTLIYEMNLYDEDFAPIGSLRGCARGKYVGMVEEWFSGEKLLPIEELPWWMRDAIPPAPVES